MAPDRRSHRGPHPKDADLFHRRHHADLRRAVSELGWLLTREYSATAALKLVGDRYSFTSRQRTAVLRCSCSDQALEQVRRGTVDPPACAGSALGIDGYNVLITLETALSGGLVLVGRDGRCRDLASVHGSYRKVRETSDGLVLILNAVLGLRPARIDFYLDQPVSNSGRLKALLAELLERETPAQADLWNIELLPSPDRQLRDYDGVVATGDSAVLRHCSRTLDLAGAIIRTRVPQAWVLDLRQQAGGGSGAAGTRW